ncbi:MAG TPA: type VI secretion system tube protein Hcp [Methylomirabilota bacterium]|nr:type VI secretion system tube protein Hcp [Methylomirabilota bacterium]
MAYDVFMKIDAIAGESVDNKYKDWIDVVSFSWGATHSPTGGAISAQDFSFVLKIDKSSPLLFKYFSTAVKLDSAIIAVRKAGKDQQELFMEYKLTNVIISSFTPATRGASAPLPGPSTGVPGAIQSVVGATTGTSGDEVAAAGFNFRPQAVQYTVVGLDGKPVSFELNFARDVIP